MARYKSKGKRSFIFKIVFFVGVILILYFLAGGGAETITMYSHQEHQVRNFPVFDRPVIFSIDYFLLVTSTYAFTLWTCRMLHNLDRIEKKISIHPDYPIRTEFFC